MYITFFSLSLSTVGVLQDTKKEILALNEILRELEEENEKREVLFDCL